MRKGISLVSVLALLMMLACPVFATNTFVPSVTYKDTPTVGDVVIQLPEDLPPELEEQVKELLKQSTITGDYREVGPCLVITSILQAEEKATDIFQETRDLLLSVYEALSSGYMDLFASDGNGMGLNYGDKTFEVIHLLDVSFRESTCHNPYHLHHELLELEGVDIAIDFDLGVAANANVVALHYRDGYWKPVKSLTNNGDGTVTCVFEHFCPVAFCVEVGEDNTPPQTGDEVGTDMILWLSAMLISMAGLMVLLVLHRRANQK